ncbi:MAG: hypothetical protein K6E54_03870 [Bacteroidaceae bacterium]|nr:hypothetical protein [Bacteroidaceae bacterium]
MKTCGAVLGLCEARNEAEAEYAKHKGVVKNEKLRMKNEEFAYYRPTVGLCNKSSFILHL